MFQYLCYGFMGAGILVIALGDFLAGGALLAVGVGLHVAMGH